MFTFACLQLLRNIIYILLIRLIGYIWHLLHYFTFYDGLIDIYIKLVMFNWEVITYTGIYIFAIQLF